MMYKVLVVAQIDSGTALQSVLKSRLPELHYSRGAGKPAWFAPAAEP
jgi:hypothetical protein